jgi:CheY-like chemotaxis protein
MEKTDSTVAKLADHQQIKDVLTRYAVAIDTKDWLLLKTCFTNDGAVDYGPEIGRYEGPDNIVAIVRSFVGDLDATHHLTGNHQIIVDGDTASCVSYLHAQHCLAGVAEGENYTLGGVYRDTLGRMKDGWQIKLRKIETVWTTGNSGIFEKATNRRQTNLTGKRILAVDDEPDVLDTIEDLLPQCEVVKATRFEDAAKLLNEELFDVAVLDIMGVDGYQLLDIAQERKITPVMMTAHEDTQKGVVVSYSKGAASYIPKEKLADIAKYLNDILQAEKEGKSGWGVWLKNFKGYFDEKFGSEIDWKKEYRKFWEKMYRI